MSNKVVFEVYVDDNGTLKAATKGVHDLGAEVGKTASAHKSASKAADSHFNRQEKGIIGTANGTKSFSKMRDTINGGSGSLVGAYATLAANIFAVSAAFLALKNAAQLQQVQAGIESMGNRMGITLSLTTKKVAELSGGLLTAQQAAVSTAQTMAAGFKTSDLERITVVARQASLTLGRDMTDSMDRLTRGVIKLEPELLDELGIMTRLDEANQIYAKSSGKLASSLTVTEKRQAFLNAALAEGELKFGGIAGDDKLNNIAKLGTAFQNLTKDILNAVNVVAIPLAGLLGNKGLLLGGMVLFASTISNQLLPGLTKSAEKAKELAAATAKISRETATTNIISGRAGSKTSGQGAFDKVIASAKKEAVSVKDITSLYGRINADIETANSKLDSSAKFKARETEDSVRNVIKVRKEQLIVTRQLLIAETQAALAAKEHNALNISTLGMSFGQGMKAKLDAIRGASEIYTENLTAISHGTLSAEKANSKLNTGMIKVRSGFMTASLAVRVFGSALLGAIPIIGQIILVATLLFEGLKAGYTAIVGKDVIRARDDLKEVSKAYIDQLKEIDKAKKSSVNAAIKEQQIATITTNSLAGLADAYDAINKAKQDKSNKDYDKALAAQNLRIANGSKAALVEPKVSRTVVDKESGLATIENMRKVSAETDMYITKLVALNGTQTAVNKSTEIQAKIIRQVAVHTANLAPVVDELIASFKGLEDAYVSFNKSITPTTPYDALSASLGKARGALVSTSVELSRGTASAADFASVLVSMGPSTLAVLPKEVKALTDAYIELASIKQKIATMDAEGKSGSATYIALVKEKAKVEASINSTSKSTLNIATVAIFQEEEKVNLIKAQNIEYQGMLAMAQAQLGVLNKYTDLSGKGTADRLRQENRVKSIQAQQLLLQASQLKAAIELQTVQINSINKELEKNSLLKEQLYTTSSISSLIKLQTALQSNLSDKERKDTEAALTQLNAKIELERQRDSARAGANSAIMQAAAATADMNSVAYIAASKTAVLAKTNATISKNELDISEASLKVSEATLDIENALSGKVLSTVEAYNKVKNAQDEILDKKKEAAKAELASELTEIAKNKQLAYDSNRSDSETRKKYDRLKLQAQEKYDLQVQLLDAEARSTLIAAANIKNEEQLLEVLKEQVAQAQSYAETKSRILDQEIEIAKQAKSANQGKSITALQEARINSDYFKKKAESIELERSVKETSIDLEYDLLDLKLRISREEYRLARQKLEDEGKGTSNLATTYDNILGKMDVLLSKDGWQLNPKVPTQTIPSSVETATGQTIVDEVVVESKKAIKGKGLLDTLRQAAKTENNNSATLANQDNAKGTMVQGIGGTDFSTSKEAPLFDKLGVAALAASEQLAPLQEILKSMGPDGELMLSVQQGAIGIADSIARIGKSGFGTKAAIANSLSAVSDIIGQINSIMQASSKAKVAGIDSEIAAEQKRDGKSAESIARIAAMEKKKDAALKKAFEINKKMMIAQTIMSTASAIMMALATYPGPAGIIMAGVYGALGAAQLAMIASTSYQSSASASSAAATPSSLSIGKRSDSVDLAKSNTSAGGESGYLTGAQGQGSSASNFRRAAYGGRAGIIVGEKGPEEFIPDSQGTIVPADKTAQSSTPINASFNIHAMDASGVEDVLTRNRGHIIGMLREAANANGQNFLENVNLAQYKQPRRL